MRCGAGAGVPGVLTGKLDAIGLLFGALALVAWGTGKLGDGRTVAAG
jgi:hypothetical protein